MHGEYGMSETRELISHDGQPLFERNSRDTFYVTSVHLSVISIHCISNVGSSCYNFLCSRCILSAFAHDDDSDQHF